MARRILNRMEMRADYDAAERRQQDDDERDVRDDATDAEDDGAAEADAEDDGNGAPKKRQPAVNGTRTRSRSRSAKVTRMKVVWGVFNNANQRVAVFDYPRRHEADQLAAQLKADNNLTHFVQPVKEPIAD